MLASSYMCPFVIIDAVIATVFMRLENILHDLMIVAIHCCCSGTVGYCRLEFSDHMRMKAGSMPAVLTQAEAPEVRLHREDGLSLGPASSQTLR